MLKVKQSTNVYGLYGEVVRYPMNIAGELITSKYWLKLLNSNNTLIVNIRSVLETYSMNKVQTMLISKI